MTIAGARPSSNKRWLRALELTSGLGRLGAPTFPDMIDEQARLRPDAPALLSDRESLTFAGLADRSNRYSRWALSLGLAPGTAVGLLLPNRPDTVAAWIGLSRVGVAAALLNTGLVGPALAHSVAAASPAHVIAAGELATTLAEALSSIAQPPRAWIRDGDLEAVLAALPGGPLGPGERRPPRPDDRALLIYTSGTTGLPKAASVSHRRVATWARWFAGLAAIGPEDRMYDALPLFHSVGGVVAPGCMLSVGGSAVIAERFSASSFWDDVRRWDCTLFQYIGELCRFLLAAAPPGAATPEHRLRLGLGNGLRADVWEEFQRRFAVPEIMEFYAATEGSFSLVNVEGEVGSVGRVPALLAHRFPADVVRFDHGAGLPARGRDGLCLRADPDEVGEAIGRLGADGGRFEGYADAAADEAKLLRDVFAPGDRWFRTGDLMRRDARGFFFFVDRIGDTYRWCGENVSTTEVEAALAGAPGVVDAAAYGVAVPHRDGRAGMATLVVRGDFALDGLRAHAAARLAAYARPAFLRIARAIDGTATFKHRKAPLARDGFDPAAVADALYVDDREAGAYVRLDAELHARIVAGTFRL